MTISLRIAARTFLAVALLAVLAAAGVSTPAVAQHYIMPQSGDAKVSAYIVTYNSTNHRAWVTIQDLWKTRNLDWGWNNPHSSREWHSGQYTTSGNQRGAYYVRFEVAALGDARQHPKIIADTRAEAVIHYCDGDVQSGITGVKPHVTAILKQGPNNHFWIEFQRCKKK